LNKYYEVVSVPDGISAIYSLRTSNNFSLIVMDPDLHDMADGELLKYLRQSSLYSDIPMVILSSMEQHLLGSIVKKYGVEQHFSKPFNPMKFLESVDALLMGRDHKEVSRSLDFKNS
jgi:type IV pili sensor histidine kinase/response regulator